MYLSDKPKFKHSNLIVNPNNGKNYIQLQLALKLGKKRYSFGRENDHNYQKAIKAGIAIDEYCDRCISNNSPLDYLELKKLVNSISKPHLQVVNVVTVKQVWEDYVKFHLSLGGWSESYINTHIYRINLFINRDNFPQDLSKPSKTLEFFLDGKRSVRTARDRFKLIVGAVDWASKNDKLDRQLGIKWRDCLSSLNSKLKTERKLEGKQASTTEDEQIDPFSTEEIEQILDALENETYSRYRGKHYQYYHYTKFLWLTGCRPSEAIALKWNNVHLLKKKIKFCEGEIMASGKLCRQQGTKTEPFRYFPINQDLEQLLAELPRDSEYVFMTCNGDAITQRNLSRLWLSLLPKLGIRHRVPYQLRHSMISYHANRGFPLPQLAKIVGNSEKIIREHYLKIDFTMINVPNID